MCPHKVVKLDDSKPQIHPEQERRNTIERCVEALVHSCLCHDAFCRELSCMKMKRVVIHTSICKRKRMGDCPICKQLIALCCYHAKVCKVTRCVVPFCNTVKIKLRQQILLYERLDAARGLRPAQQDESDAIDVNMHGAPVFGDDVPSGSGQNASQPGPSGVRGAGSSATSPGPSGAKPRANRPYKDDATGVAKDDGNGTANGGTIEAKIGANELADAGASGFSATTDKPTSNDEQVSENQSFEPTLKSSDSK